VVPGMTGKSDIEDIEDSPDCSQGALEPVDTAAADNRVEHSFVGVLESVRDRIQVDRSVPAGVVALPVDAAAVSSQRVVVPQRCRQNHLRIIPAVFFEVHFFCYRLQGLLPVVGF